MVHAKNLHVSGGVTLSCTPGNKTRHLLHPTHSMTKYEIIYDGFGTTRGLADTENKAAMHEEQQTEGDETVTRVNESASDENTCDVHVDQSSGDATMEGTYEEEYTAGASTTSTKDGCDEGVTTCTINYGPSCWARADAGPAAGELLVNDSFLDHSSGATLDDDEHEYTVEPTQRSSDKSSEVDISTMIPNVPITDRETSAVNCVISMWDWRVGERKRIGKDIGTIDITQTATSQTEPKGHSSNLDNTDSDQAQPDASKHSKFDDGDPERSPFPLSPPNTKNQGCIGDGTDKSMTKDVSATDVGSPPITSQAGETNLPLSPKNYKPLGDRHLKRLARNELRIARAEGRLRSVSGVLLPALCPN